MKRAVDRAIIDCDNGGASFSPVDISAGYIAERLMSINNPYTGNKRKLLIPLFRTIDKKGWKYETFMDLFSGSGMVSAAARYLGKTVYSNDLSDYAFLNAKYFLEIDSVLSDDDKKTVLDTAIEPKEFVRKFYAHRFTPSEALILDRLKTNIDLYMPGGRCGGRWASNEAVIAYLSILHYVADHCFVGGRLNKGQVLAELEHRLNHQRNQGKEMPFTDIDWLKPIDKLQDKPRGIAFNLDAIEFLSITILEADICYIDPPYGGSQSNYSQMYRFFEEYLLNGCQVVETDCHKRFVETKSYKQQFETLIDAAKKIPKLVFSYNDESWANVDLIVETIKRFRKDVFVEKVNYEYNYRDTSRAGQEYIILAE